MGMSWYVYMGVNPKIGGVNPQNGWFITEKPVKMYDLGGPLFLETPICLVVSCLNIIRDMRCRTPLEIIT